MRKGGGPADSPYIMTWSTVPGKPSLFMIHFFCAQEIIFMTLDTSRPNAVKTQRDGRLMTIITIRHRMISQKRKGYPFMHPGYILYHPGARVMTSGTIISQRLAVHVLMTVYAFG